jgi:hypothetical protein
MMHSKMKRSKMKGEDGHESVREVAGILMHFIPRATPETHLTSSGTRSLGHPRKNLRRDRSVCSGGNPPPVIAATPYSLDMPETCLGKSTRVEQEPGQKRQYTVGGTVGIGDDFSGGGGAAALALSLGAVFVLGSLETPRRLYAR